MLRRVIALHGIGDVGKSQTVKKAYELLMSKYTNAIPDPRFRKYKVDITAILTIGKVKVGIESNGDPCGRLEGSLSLFVRAGCSVIICATRTRGQTFDAVTALEHHDPPYKVIRLPQAVKSNESERGPSNLAMAEQLVELAEEVINA